MEALRAKGYDGALKEYLMLAGEGGERGGGKRFFGICIGMQVRGGFQYVLGGLVGELVGELRSPIPPPRTSRPTLGWGGLAALVHPTPHTAHSHSLTHSLTCTTTTFFFFFLCRCCLRRAKRCGGAGWVPWGWGW